MKNTTNLKTKERIWENFWLISTTNTKSYTLPTREKIKKILRLSKQKTKEYSKKKFNKEEFREKRKSLLGQEEFRSNFKKWKPKLTGDGSKSADLPILKRTNLQRSNNKYFWIDLENSRRSSSLRALSQISRT